MLRRSLLAGAAGFALFTPDAGAQEPLHRIGVLFNISYPGTVEAWQKGLRDHGYVEGGNLLVEYRYVQNRPERIPVLATALKPELIVASGPQPVLTVRAAAPKTPLVFANVADPVGLGLVESYAHPGGSATGLATIVLEGFDAKQLQLLKEVVPSASRIAVLMNPRNALHQRAKSEFPEIERQLGVTLIVVEASGLSEAETAFGAARKQGTEAIEIWGDAYTSSQFQRS